MTISAYYLQKHYHLTMKSTKKFNEIFQLKSLQSFKQNSCDMSK